MNWAHIHLMLNHLPVIGSWFGAAFLLIAVLRRNDTLMSSALVIFIFTALMAIASDISGDRAEHVVRSLPGVTRSYIHEHEEAADVAYMIAEIVGLGAVIGLVARKRGKTPGQWYGWVMLGGALLLSVVMLRTANLGGEIRHTEIRSTQDTTAVGPE